MKHNEFKIGLSFWTDTGEWRVTDMGTRTVIAVPLDTTIIEIDRKTRKQTKKGISIVSDPQWWAGPPYAVTETVFDENDFPSCTLKPSKLK